MPEKGSKNKFVQIILLVVILAVFGSAAWYFFSLYDSFNVENLKLFIDGFGPWAPIVYVVIYTISSPIPFLATVISAAAGLLFGLVPGMLLAMFSAVVSSIIPFYLARSLGREWVEGRLKSDQLKATYQKSEGQGGFLFVLLMRLIPVLPWEVQNYVAGLTKVKIPVFLLGTLIGIIPGSFALVFLGDSISDPSSWQFFAAIGINIIFFLIPVIYLFIKNRIDKRKRKEKAADEESIQENLDEVA
jgi:uncharacterized membrane protein YdjX (TVP38/TMEM64 family)